MNQFLFKTVEQVMSREVTVVSPEITIRKMESLFEQYGFNMFPVVEQGTLLGVVSEFDYLRAFIFTNQAPVPAYDVLMEQPVSAIYSRKPLTVRPEQPLPRVLEMMVESMYKSFPVVDQHGTLRGVLARRDLIQALRPSSPT